jgi:hypothetical protein
VLNATKSEPIPAMILMILRAERWANGASKSMRLNAMNKQPVKFQNCFQNKLPYAPEVKSASIVHARYLIGALIMAPKARNYAELNILEPCLDIFQHLLSKAC